MSQIVSEKECQLGQPRGEPVRTRHAKIRSKNSAASEALLRRSARVSRVAVAAAAAAASPLVAPAVAGGAGAFSDGAGALFDGAGALFDGGADGGFTAVAPTISPAYRRPFRVMGASAWPCSESCDFTTAGTQRESFPNFGKWETFERKFAGGEAARRTVADVAGAGGDPPGGKSHLARSSGNNFADNFACTFARSFAGDFGSLGAGVHSPSVSLPAARGAPRTAAPASLAMLRILVGDRRRSPPRTLLAAVPLSAIEESREEAAWELPPEPSPVGWPAAPEPELLVRVSRRVMVSPGLRTVPELVEP